VFDVPFDHTHHGFYLPSLVVFGRSSVLKSVEHSPSLCSLWDHFLVNRTKWRDDRFHLVLVTDQLEAFLGIETGIC
jgi:hypothetical protein